MSLEKTQAAMEQLLFECGISKEDLDAVNTIIPTPSISSEPAVRGRPKNAKIGSKGVNIQKYLDMSDASKFPTKESKMHYVLFQMIRSTSPEFILDMKTDEWIMIDYSRPYKTSLGGPVVLVGDKTDAASAKDKKCGRERFGEINGKFPIYNLLIKLKIRFKKEKHKYCPESLDSDDVELDET